MQKQLRHAFVCGLAALVVTGCASYYRVTDPTDGRTYYTQALDEKGGGAVAFKDARNDAQVTIQNSQVEKLDKKEYEEGMRLQAAATAERSAAAAAAPAAAAPATPTQAK